MNCYCATEQPWKIAVKGRKREVDWDWDIWTKDLADWLVWTLEYATLEDGYRKVRIRGMWMNLWRWAQSMGIVRAHVHAYQRESIAEEKNTKDESESRYQPDSARGYPEAWSMVFWTE